MKISIKAKILISAILLTVVASVAVLISNIALFADFVDSSTLTEVDAATKVAVNNLNFLKSEAKAASLSIAKDDVIIRAIENNNREELIVRARALQHETGVEFCTIIDKFGNVILRTHAPNEYGDSLASQANIQAAMYGDTLTTIEAGTIVRLSVRSGTPIIDSGNNIIGVISAGYRLDTPRFVDSIKEMIGCEISIVLGDDRIATTVLQADGTRAVGTKADPAIIKKVQTDGFYSGKVSILNRPTVCNYIPIHDPDEQMIGMIFIGQYIDEGKATIQAFIQSGSIIIFLVLLISVVMLVILVERIVSPIRAMTNAASALAVGDTDIEIQVNTHDEMRILANAFNRMIDNTRQQIQVIEHIANGDLAVSIYPRSEKDTMNRMLEKLDSTLKAQSSELANALIEAKQANNAKSDFLAKMSHEMRTPLNAIIGLSEIALSNIDIDEETKTNLEKIYNSGSTLLSIVNDILDISKIHSGKFVIIPNEYDVPSLINDSILQNILSIGSNPIQFVLDINDDMPARLYGDELRIKQIINNLLSNAFKYTEKGKVELMLRCAKDGDAICMTIRVSDTGLGIRPENLLHLFDDYEQFGTTSREMVSGSGLGLAIAKKLIEMMDGAIDVESVYGVGSVFTVRLKQGYISDATLGANVARELKNLQYSTDKLNRNMHTKRIQLAYAHILLVDDNMTNLDVTKGLLKPYGVQIDCVTSGPEAINAIREEKVIYSAIFMDHMMPNMDGIEATQIIRENIGTQYAETVPIIALTANAIVGSEKMFLSKGFQAFISKPIDMTKLDQVLNQWVRDKSIEAELSYIEAGTTSLTIDNIDMQKALERFSGDKAVLIDVLRSYMTNTRPLLSRLAAAVAAEDIEDYAIAIHGVKGASYSICAQKAGMAAEQLETAAKAGNFDAVKSAHPAFVELVETLLEEIKQTLSEAEILIVDDNETSRKAIIGQLKPLMLHIDTANNGKEALWMISKKHYHLIFMDYMMPVMDGIETVRKLRQMEGEYYKNVPVIAFTAHNTGELKLRFLRAGMSDFLIKPVETAQLYEKIKYWLPDKLYEYQPVLPTQRAETLPIIEGINNQEAIRYSGTKELFIKLLGDFYRHIDLKASKIEQYLAEGLIKELTIEIHALRNTARIIGASELSDGFAKLEHYGNEGNIESLEQEVPKVLAQYCYFKSILKPFGELAELEKNSVSEEKLILLLRELISAMERFNIDAADIIFKQLEELRIPAECYAHMEMLRASMAEVAIDDVMQSAEAMIEVIEKLTEDMK